MERQILSLELSGDWRRTGQQRLLWLCTWPRAEQANAERCSLPGFQRALSHQPGLRRVTHSSAKLRLWGSYLEGKVTPEELEPRLSCDTNGRLPMWPSPHVAVLPTETGCHSPRTLTLNSHSGEPGPESKIKIEWVSSPWVKKAQASPSTRRRAALCMGPRADQPSCWFSERCHISVSYGKSANLMM